MEYQEYIWQMCIIKEHIVLGNTMQLFINSIRNEGEGISCYFKPL